MSTAITETINALTAFQFERPWVLAALPIIALLLLFLLTRDFVKAPLQPAERRNQRRRRVWLFVSRLLIMTLLLLAMAQPYTERLREVQGNPRAIFLLDTSGSMAHLDTRFVEGLVENIGRSVSATLRTAGTERTSDLGNALLQNLEPGGNIILISDGNPTTGPALRDVAFYATTLNATISVFELEPLVRDAAVLISGPAKVVAESEATFSVVVTATHDGAVPLTVDIDGSQILDREVEPGTYTFTRIFTAGTHRIQARIGEDADPQNNLFHKTVKVLPKPKILLVTQRAGPLELLLRQLYTVEKREALPPDLSPYYAIVTDDAPIESLLNTNALHTYLIDEPGGYYGGGLVLFAGLNSFDRGGYAGSPLEPLLPVKVGRGERKKGAANLVFVIDVTGTTAKTKYLARDGQLIVYNESVPTMEIIKAQVVNAIEQLQLDNRVGVIVFGVPGELVRSSEEEKIADSVRIVAKLDHLYTNRQEILDKVPRLLGGGLKAPDVAFRGAIQMLRGQQGDKNIILVTDGRYSVGLGEESAPKRELLTLAANAKRQHGVNLMTIGVGTEDETTFNKKVDEQFLKQLAQAGDGTYDRATRLNTLLIKWGDPKAKEYGQEFILVPLSLTHFITHDLEPSAVLNAYSQVVPKETAELLITTDSGQPALTTWRYGNGRVATWTVYAGNNQGQLLNAENSLLLSRTINWAIGDPQRKEPFFVDIPDTRIGERGIVIVRSKSPVTSDPLEFTKEGETYIARFEPAETGYGLLLNTEYAVNRPVEYDRVGLNDELFEIALSTGGKIFKPSQSEEIIRHVKEASRRVTTERELVLAPFLSGALLLLLIEIAARRITERRRRP